MSPPADADAEDADQSGSELAQRYRDLAPALHVWASLRIRPQLRAYCEVEDLLQEVWCRACALADRRVPEAAEFRPWLFRIAKNVLLEVVRKAGYAGRVQPAAAQPSRLFLLDAVPAAVTSITRRLASDDALRALHVHLLALPEDDRALAVHLGIEGLPQAEVATLLGLQQETVKKRWQRLRARLVQQGLPGALFEIDGR